MMDTEQERKSEARLLVMGKLQGLTNDELLALCYLCVAFVEERDKIRLARQQKAIGGLLGPMSLSEWLVVGPVVRERYSVLFPEVVGHKLNEA